MYQSTDLMKQKTWSHVLWNNTLNAKIKWALKCSFLLASTMENKNSHKSSDTINSEAGKMERNGSKKVCGSMSSFFKEMIGYKKGKKENKTEKKGIRLKTTPSHHSTQNMFIHSHSFPLHYSTLTHGC